MRDLPLAKVYQLLEPGPVVLLTTARRGRANIMTMSWHMMVEFEPPLIACVVSNADHSFAALRATGECVIAVPSPSSTPRSYRRVRLPLSADTESQLMSPLPCSSPIAAYAGRARPARPAQLRSAPSHNAPTMARRTLSL